MGIYMMRESQNIVLNIWNIQNYSNTVNATWLKKIIISWTKNQYNYRNWARAQLYFTNPNSDSWIWIVFDYNASAWDDTTTPIYRFRKGMTSSSTWTLMATKTEAVWNHIVTITNSWISFDDLWTTTSYSYDFSWWFWANNSALQVALIKNNNTDVSNLTITIEL